MREPRAGAWGTEETEVGWRRLSTGDCVERSGGTRKIAAHHLESTLCIDRIGGRVDGNFQSVEHLRSSRPACIRGRQHRIRMVMPLHGERQSVDHDSSVRGTWQWRDGAEVVDQLVEARLVQVALERVAE